jgi:hypothetical protein
MALNKIEGALADLDHVIGLTNHLASRAELHLEKAKLLFK